VYVVPAGTIVVGSSFNGVTVNASPLQISRVCAPTNGFGFTVTVNVNTVPPQLPEVGVTVYVAVCDTFVGFTNVPVILLPLPLAPPVTPPVTTGADHVYVVLPGTIFPLPFEGANVNPEPLHALVVCDCIDGRGFTVTVIVNGAPTHVPCAPDVGVTVYTTVCT
jgi:hypothetical protein